MKGISQKTILEILLFVIVAACIVMYFLGAFSSLQNYYAAYWALIALLWLSIKVYSTIYKHLLKGEDTEEYKQLMTNPEPNYSPPAYTLWYFIVHTTFPFVAMIFSVVGGLSKLRSNWLGVLFSLLCAVICFFVSWRAWRKLKRKRHVRPKKLYTPWKSIVKDILSSIAMTLLLFITVLASIQSLFVMLFEISYLPEGELVTLYPGSSHSHKVHLLCTGILEPSSDVIVLLFHGLGGQALDWSWIQPKLANVTRVCSYDRAGYAWSDKGQLPRTSMQISQDLVELLSRAQLTDNKFILVGHSMAGFHMRVFNKLYPDKTLGIACLDCTDPQRTRVGNTYISPEPLYLLGAHIEPLGLVRLILAMGLSPIKAFDELPHDIQWYYIQNILKPKYFETRNQEYEVLPVSALQTEQSGHLGAMPFLVFAAGKGLNTVNLTSISTNSTLVVYPDADHYLPFNEGIAGNITDHLIKFIKTIK